MDKSLDAKLVERKGKGSFYWVSCLVIINSSIALSWIAFDLPAQQLDEVRKQLETERDAKCDEVTKEFHNMKMVVESRRRDLEARQENVKAMLAEVLYTLKS